MLHERHGILVVGSGGAGKSTFARKLGELGWTQTPTAEWKGLVTQLVDTPEWIMDGNFGGSLVLRVPRCDVVVFFDFPRLVCLWGVVKRRFQFAGRARPGPA
jgi:adenylate kinase family enzyme